MRETTDALSPCDKCLHRRRCAAGEACDVLADYIETGRTRGLRVPSRELFASLLGGETYSRPAAPPASDPAAASARPLQDVEQARPRVAARQAAASAWEVARQERAQQMQEARVAAAAAREAEARRARALAERLRMSADEARTIRTSFRFPHMSIGELAGIVGSSTNAVSEWERGMRPIPPEAVASLIALRDGLWKRKGDARNAPRMLNSRGHAFLRAALED